MNNLSKDPVIQYKMRETKCVNYMIDDFVKSLINDECIAAFQQKIDNLEFKLSERYKTKRWSWRSFSFIHYCVYDIVITLPYNLSSCLEMEILHTISNWPNDSERTIIYSGRYDIINAMLHIEQYDSIEKAPAIRKLNESCPLGLEDPYDFLLTLKKQ